MKYYFINKSSYSLSKIFLNHFLKWLSKDLLIRRLRHKEKIFYELGLVLITKDSAKKLNFQFRKKKYATDILSFPSLEENSLGELVLCYEVLKKQAKNNKHSIEDEMAYLIIHGILHLLGYDHEKNDLEEKIMLRIQDQIFEKYLNSFEK